MKKRLAAGLMVLALGFAFMFISVENKTINVAETHPPIPLGVSELG